MRPARNSAADRSLDADARRQIAERFSPKSTIGRSGSDSAQQLAIDSNRLPDGKTLQEVLADEGFISRLESQKDALLRAHLADLSGALGRDKVASLERVVQQQIAPGVWRVTQVGPPVVRPPAGRPQRVRKRR